MPHIQDVLDVDKVIAEHGNKILLIGGVGSGKSTWVTEVLTKKGSVLFVTSRKAKVLEDIEYSCFSDIFRWNTNNNQTLITNAKLASIIERVSDDSMTDLDEFINHFDYIVIDEVHSLATDSAYAPSCAPVLSFIEYTSEKGFPVICMTGTSEPVQAYFNKNEWYTVDFTDICDYVHPKTISLIQSNKILTHISSIDASRKIVYFANHLDTIISICKELLDKEIFTATEIAITVSKNSETKLYDNLSSALTYSGDSDIIQATSTREYSNIIKHKQLADGCRILFSTSVLKEGINIKNSDLVLFCENHILSNLIQYFGRARSGDADIFVIDDSNGHTIMHSELLYTYAFNSEVKAANHFYRSFIDCENNPFTKQERKALTTHVCKNPYIYFDYIKQQYCVFSLKYEEEIRLIKQESVWKEILTEYCTRYGITQKWFKLDKQYDEILLELAKKETYFWKQNQKDILWNLLSIAYGITKKQPQKINKELADKGKPIRIRNGKDDTAKHRGESYWQLYLIE